MSDNRFDAVREMLADYLSPKLVAEVGNRVAEIMLAPQSDEPAVWVGVSDFGDGPIAQGPYDTLAAANEDLGDDDQFEIRKVPRGEALAALAVVPQAWAAYKAQRDAR